MREPKAADGADRVIEAATMLFVGKGYAGTSMAQIARDAGMQKASLYHHFPSKEALFVACVTNGIESTFEQVDLVRRRGDLTHEEKLRAILSVVHEHLVTSPVGRMSPLIAETSRTIPVVARDFWDTYIARMQRQIGEIVDEGVQDGAFRRLEPRAFELMVFGPMIYVSLSNQMFGRFDDLADHFDPKATFSVHIEEVMRMIRADRP